VTEDEALEELRKIALAVLQKLRDRDAPDYEAASAAVSDLLARLDEATTAVERSAVCDELLVLMRERLRTH
jgi:hypothetical protein